MQRETMCLKHEVLNTKHVNFKIAVYNKVLNKLYIVSITDVTKLSLGHGYAAETISNKQQDLRLTY